MTVIEYVTEEVRRQGHDVTREDGLLRVGWMLLVWAEAVRDFTNGLPPLEMVEKWGTGVEPNRNWKGFRTVGVQVGGRLCPQAGEVPGLLNRLWEHGGELTPLEFYKEFEMIHPFVDGNGRTGKIILNWMNGTLLDPIFPPADLFGKKIRNP